MKRVLMVVGLLGCGIAACSGSSGSGEVDFDDSHLRLEQPCSADSDCPTDFKCETESEHGVTSSFCSSVAPVSPDGTSGARCPEGFEVENEHGTLFCELHGGHDGGAGATGNEGSGHDGDEQAAGGSHEGPGHDGDEQAAGGSHEGPGHDGNEQAAGGSHEGPEHEAAGGSHEGPEHDGGGGDTGDDGHQGQHGGK